jgi:hypothetical protein
MSTAAVYKGVKVWLFGRDAGKIRGKLRRKETQSVLQFTHYTSKYVSWQH